MKIGSILENQNIEKRIAVTPETAKKYIALGFEVMLSESYGDHLGFKNKEYEDNCRLLLNSLGIKGPAVTQFFVTSNGEFKFIEVNARVGGAYTSTILSGLRFWEFLINNELKDSWKFQRPLIGRYQRVQKDSYDNNI